MRLILVPVADRPECARALRTAFDLGNRLDASISGCHMRRHRHSDISLSPEFAEAAWRRKNTRRAPAAARALYEAIAENNGYEVTRRARPTPGALWSERVGSPEALMGIVGPVADLIVVSRPRKSGSVADVFVSSAITRTGRPVLILPQRCRKRIGKRICIAWDQSTAAAIAVTPAIPVLQQAEEVTIVTCGPEDKPGPKAVQLAAYLQHWGVETSRVHTKGRDVEGELLAASKKVGADLMIGGAYSRGRWRERVFGGTSEFLVHKSKIAVLLRHV